MLQNKAENYDSVVQDIEESNMTTNVKEVNGNTISCELTENTHGTFDVPAYPDWYVTQIRDIHGKTTITISFIR